MSIDRENLLTNLIEGESMFFARLDGANCELTDKRRMSTSALVEELHSIYFGQAPSKTKAVVEELYHRHVIVPMQKRQQKVLQENHEFDLEASP